MLHQQLIHPSLYIIAPTKFTFTRGRIISSNNDQNTIGKFKFIQHGSKIVHAHLHSSIGAKTFPRHI